MCFINAPLNKNSPQTCVSTFPRRVFGPIHPVPAFLWHPDVPAGDGHGTVHLARVHHLLEVLLSLVWRSVCGAPRAKQPKLRRSRRARPVSMRTSSGLDRSLMLSPDPNGRGNVLRSLEIVNTTLHNLQIMSSRHIIPRQLSGSVNEIPRLPSYQIKLSTPAALNSIQHIVILT